MRYYDKELFYKSWVLRFFFKIYQKSRERYRKYRRRFLYRIEIIEKRYKKIKNMKRFISLRVSRLYFLILKDYQFRIIFKKALRLDGNMEENYVIFLECRLSPLIYRCNFVHDILNLTRFVKYNSILINYKLKNSPNLIVRHGQLISLANRKIRFRIERELLWRLKKRAILFNTPKYLFVSYIFFFAYLCKMPRKKGFSLSDCFKYL